MEFEDKTIVCYDCNNEFTFTAEEQEEFHARGHYHDPKRCLDCRQARKAKRQESTGSNYESGNYGFNSRRQMFPAVCAECGVQTQVPFEPSQGRPVYCSDCYRKIRPSR